MASALRPLNDGGFLDSMSGKAQLIQLFSHLIKAQFTAIFLLVDLIVCLLFLVNALILHFIVLILLFLNLIDLFLFILVLILVLTILFICRFTNHSEIILLEDTV